MLLLVAAAEIISMRFTCFQSRNSKQTSNLSSPTGNAAFKGKQWNKSVNYYTKAITLKDSIATYYCNRSAAYLELGCYQEAETDCTKAISIDKRNVKAYLRRGTAKHLVVVGTNWGVGDCNSAKAIDEYAIFKTKDAESNQEAEKVDPRLEATVERILRKCILDQKF
ncbi:hypothetical protein C5167_008851 [Papaver somniferum]|uniref:Uncharacterized protein n=1 Tax=Papaver somniferum TaxID=3469 RepID=A0A4Y7JYP1_PAPSO|nr:hypothetical protein C5167_008851 [Papaver somniferum]